MGGTDYFGGGDLADVLPALKRRGCSLLITGEVSDRVSMVASRRLFGSADRDRRRVVGLTRQAARKPNRWFPADVDRTAETTTVVELAESAEGASDADEPAERVRPVREDVEAAVDRVVGGDSLDPGQLRVGVYSVSPLVGRFGREPVFALLEAIADVVTEYRGMGHVHLPWDDGARVVEALDPLFDARIELRQVPAAGPTPEQRWHVDELTTEWVEL